MAIIYSNRNDNTGSHTTANSLATSTWAGGVVPGAADQVYVVGRRTTISSSYSKWVGSTQTINVASTTNFATSGFFYTHTSYGNIVKINYTGTTSTTFTGCSIDESDPFYEWSTGATLASGYYVHNPAYIIEINNGQTFECNELIIQEGGWLKVNSGGTLKLNQGMIVRDGRLLGQGSGTITITRPAGTTGTSTIGYINTENYNISIIDIEGNENRTYSTLAANCNVGDGYVTITGANNGSFAVGDEVAIYGHDNYRRRNVGYNGYRDATCNVVGEGMDEGFEVVGVSGNTIYLGIFNDASGDIKSVATVGSQKVIEVEPDNIYFNAGDKVVVNNAVYTIDSVEDSQYQVYNYDFTNPNTDLSDFWVDDSTHVYSAGWNIESGVGIRNTTGAYRELVHKYLWKRDVIVEAEMSPLDGYTSGTRGAAAFGLLSSYDPAFRWGHRGYETFKSDYLIIDDGNQDFYFAIRSMTNYGNNRADRVTAILNATRTAATYKVDTRKYLTTVYFNGEEFTQEFRRDGNFKGLVGLFTNGNSQFRCKRMTIWIPTQKIYITTNDSIPSSGNIHRTGAEKKHFTGDRIVKISSTNTGDGSHKDLAFAYRGTHDVGVWPLITQTNGTNGTNSSLPYIHNHDMNYDYYINMGNGAGPYSVTIDLQAQTQFTHVSFLPRTNDLGGFYGYNGVTIYGSNDLSNWTTLYAQTNDTKKWYGGGGSFGRLAFYATGTASYRYVKFETRGDQSGSLYNRYVNIGVHDFSNGYSLSLNNASDFNVGDKITVATDSGWGYSSREYEAYQARILNNADPESYMHGGWATECTITSKSDNTIYLDKPVWWGYIEDSDSVTVMKTNRNFTIQGTIGDNNVFSDSWRWPNIYFGSGGSVGRKYLLRHIRFNYIGSQRYSSSTSFNRGFTNYSQDYWNHVVLDGCVHNFGPDGSTWQGVGNQYGMMMARNNVIMGMYTGLWQYYASSYSGSGIFNNKILNTWYGIYSNGFKASAINYNEIATFGDYGLTYATTRVDRNVIPFFNEINYNSVKGGFGYGFQIASETVGPRRSPKITMKGNKFRGMDDLIIVGNTFDGWPYEGTNAFAEHTGSRLARYRNAGFMSEGDTSSDLSAVSRQDNFGRYGFSLLKGIYYHYYRDPANPEVTRVFPGDGDDYLSILGIEIEVLQDVPFQIVVQFDWRIPVMATLQDDGNGRGAMFTYAIQNGTRIASNYTANPPNTITPNIWNTSQYTFNTFTSTAGKVGVYLARDALNGYVDLKNGSAKVYTDNPEAINVIGNTFDMSNLWDQYRSKRDISQLTKANARTINISRLKF